MLSELVVDRYGDDAGGNVDLVRIRLAGKVQPPVSGLSPHGVADGLQIRHGVELRQDMVEEELAFLLVVKVVEGAGFKGVEAIISGSNNGESLSLRIVELILKLSD